MTRRDIDPSTLVASYLAGRRITEIAEEHQCHRSIIYRALNEAGVQRRDDRLTPRPRPKQEWCGHGLHRLTDDDGHNTKNAAIDHRGRRYCRPCSQFRWTLRSFRNSQAHQPN